MMIICMMVISQISAQTLFSPREVIGINLGVTLTIFRKLLINNICKTFENFVISNCCLVPHGITDLVKCSMCWNTESIERKMLELGKILLLLLYLGCSTALSSHHA